MTLTAAAAAEAVQGEIIGDASVALTGLSSAANARAGDLTFAEKDSYFEAASRSPAAAILVSEPYTSADKVLIRVKNVRVATARLLPLFYPPRTYAAGIHPSAVIDPSARVDPSAHIGPNVVVAENVHVGAGTALVAGNHLGAGCRVGDGCVLFPRVVIYPDCVIGNRVSIHAGTVIGADGYGYVFDAGIHRKLLQVGRVVIGDDVEIGANTCIDRAAFAETTVGAGTKIDNLVHVAHNVAIGKHCLIMGQVGFAGSTTLSDYVVVASQSGIAGHLSIGRQAIIGAKSGVMRDIPDGGVVLGIPAVADKQAKRQWIATQQLPDLIQRMRAVEKELAKLSPPQA